MTSELGALTWPEADERIASSLLAVPLGATEQHGPHLPLATDTLVAVAVTNGLAHRRGDVLVAPPLPYGSSGEHRDFPGTLSIGTEALVHLLVELVRSADGFRGVIMVSGHGGNVDALRRAAADLGSEGRRVAVWWPTADALAPEDADAHAGRVETSLVLALDPEVAKLERARAGTLSPLGELMETMTESGVRAVTQNGVLGDPTGATAAEGRRFLARFVDDVEAAVSRSFGPAERREQAVREGVAP